MVVRNFYLQFLTEKCASICNSSPPFFAYHLHKTLTGRAFRVNGKQPTISRRRPILYNQHFFQRILRILKPLRTRLHRNRTSTQLDVLMAKENLHFDNKPCNRNVLIYSLHLSSFSINLLALYHKCRSVIGFVLKETLGTRLRGMSTYQELQLQILLEALP